MTAAPASPSWSGRSWGGSRRRCCSSTSTAASCSRCSSAATRSANCSRINWRNSAPWRNAWPVAASKQSSVRRVLLPVEIPEHDNEQHIDGGDRGEQRQCSVGTSHLEYERADEGR